MKLSLSLTEEDVAVLDRYILLSGAPSRSAAVRAAIQRLRDTEIEDAYVEAFAEWADDPDSKLWDAVADDGLADA